MFADGYPYLLANEASVTEVNNLMQKQLVTYRNFRTNILVTGVAAFEEVSLLSHSHLGHMILWENSCEYNT